MTDNYSGKHSGAHKHTFGRVRPILRGHFPVALDAGAQHRDTRYRDLPVPEAWRTPPYRLALADVLGHEEIAAIEQNKRLTFHLNGDMGGIKDAVPQELVAKGMEKSFDPDADASANPSFLYITGDCVYFNGQIEEYYKQFYEPYEFYPRPIFAVAGNHDGENLTDDGSRSLDGFMRNFCAQHPEHLPEALDSHRTAMTQPYVYWTLTTPLCNIVGLYSNVPEGGDIRNPQLAWYVNELKTLPQDVPLFVALHHPPYSADDHHSGSAHILKLLDDAATEAGRWPDMVLAGHVHNYQRISRTDSEGRVTPYLVTGAGGYHNLHHVLKVNHQAMVPPVVLDRGERGDVMLHSYLDDHHGFLVMTVTPDLVIGDYYQVPRPQEPFSKGNQLVDHWEFDWKAKQWRINDLSGSAGSSLAPAEPIPFAPQGHPHRNPRSSR